MSQKEIPIHPEFTRALRKIHDRDLTKVPAARTLFKRANHALITNYDTHTADATLPFTRITTAELDLPSNLFREHSPSYNPTPTEQLLALGDGKKLKVAILPGTAPAGGGNPEDNVRRMINLVGQALAKGQKLEIFSTGLAVSRDGHIPDDWPDKLKQTGFQQHGEAYADLVLTHVLPKTQQERDETVLFLLGESMGCYNVRETAKILGETGVETYLYLKNPPGPEGIQSPLLRKSQVILGYVIENGIRRLTSAYANKGTPQGRQDKTFSEQLSDYLTTEKDLHPDDEQQRKLKWQSVVIDGKNLLDQLPFSLDGVSLPTIIDYGLKDLTSFTPQRLKVWKAGKHEWTEGNITYVLDPHAHTPQHDIWEWADKLVG